MRVPFSAYDFFGYLASGVLLVSAIDLAFGASLISSTDISPIKLIQLSFIAYVLGHGIAHLSSWLIEHNFVRKVLTSPTKVLFQKSTKSRWNYIFPGYFTPLPKGTQQRILEKSIKQANIREPGEALFFHCRSVVMKSEFTRDRLATFLQLYGFCRNTSLAAFLSSFTILLSLLKETEPLTKSISIETVYSSMGIVFGIILIFRYLKFYRHYSIEVFTTYAETESLGDQQE